MSRRVVIESGIGLCGWRALSLSYVAWLCGAVGVLSRMAVHSDHAPMAASWLMSFCAFRKYASEPGSMMVVVWLVGSGHLCACHSSATFPVRAVATRERSSEVKSLFRLVGGWNRRRGSAMRKQSAGWLFRFCR